MKILFTPFQNLNLNTQKSDAPSSLKYQYRLNKDTVSFGAIKKSQLNNYQLLCANYFKAPLEKFRTPEDFSDWAKKELNDTMDPEKYPKYQDFAPYDIDKEITNDRVKRLEEWQKFIQEDKEMKLHPELALIIANSLTKELYPETKAIPPVFDKKTAKETIKEINEILSESPNATLNFKKKYQDKLRANIIESVDIIRDKSHNNPKGFWVRIPSETHDNKNFKRNIKALNALSTEKWCTKGYFAEEYLQKGDFYIYMEKNSPELSVRLEGKEIKEVRDRNHDRKIPLSYFESLRSLIQENDLKGYYSEIEELGHRQALVNLAKSIAQDDIENKNYENILKMAGIKVTKREDGLLELSNFKTPHKDYTYQDLGINENEMFRHIGAIKGPADFGGTQVTRLGKLEYIDGPVFLNCSKLIDLGKVIAHQRIYKDSD